MVLQASQFLAGRIVGKAPEDRPLLNAVPVVVNGSRLADMRSSYSEFWRKLKRTPELLSTLGIIVTDVLGDRPEWTAPDGAQLGRNKRLEAQRFWRQNSGKETVASFLMDGLLTGDGYLWKGKPTKKDIQRAVKEVSKRFEAEYGTLFVKELQAKAVFDEDIRRTRKMEHVASSTVEILHDYYEIKGYEQKSAGLTVFFETNEIIHYRYMRINGEVNGFAPAEALAAEFTLLWLVKGNMLSLMRNGGAPDKMFILPQEIAKSPNHKYLIETLRKFKSIDDRHGNLVFTGDLKVEDLQGNVKDLEYKDLALYITSNIAFAYHIPVTRIPYLIGTAAAKGDSGGLSESGYWNNISMIQDTLEDLLNSQLFEEMGWAIKFPRKYKQDEVREAQTASMNADTVTKYQTILMQNGKQLTTTKTLALLELSEDDIEEFEQPPLQTGLSGQNQLPNKQVMPEQDKQNKAGVKRNSANQKGSTEAVSTPN